MDMLIGVDTEVAQSLARFRLLWQDGRLMIHEDTLKEDSWLEACSTSSLCFALPQLHDQSLVYSGSLLQRPCGWIADRLLECRGDYARKECDQRLHLEWMQAVEFCCFSICSRGRYVYMFPKAFCNLCWLIPGWLVHS